MFLTRILLLKDVFATVAELQSVCKYLLDILLKNSILKMEPLQKSMSRSWSYFERIGL